PIPGPPPARGARGAAPPPPAISEYVVLHDLELDTFAGPEAQVAAIADDIAYNSHDLDDGLRAELFEIADLRDLPLVGGAIGEVEAAYPKIELGRLVHEMVRRIIGALVEDLLAETVRRLDVAGPASAADIRGLDAPVAALSASMAEAEGALKGFLFERMYRHDKVNRMTGQARRVVKDLFGHFMANPDNLSDEWREQALQKNEAERARVIADYIAGMTDGYALSIHGRVARK
ncbi:MAG: deoxyguanosinetriphosphate triphosphohydrolase, partial [Alphaproteobacteria bacterium]|nr:deoxyguanosinetriphosphate triphosphohydrolase [Alphaproteobacteria bacterium]